MNFMVPPYRSWFPITAPSNCLHSGFIRYSILQFITIRRIMVSNLVSNRLGGECHGWYGGYRISA